VAGGDGLLQARVQRPAAAPVAASAQSDGGTAGTEFAAVKIGGGGYVVDMDISSDGLTRLVRTDVYGGYIWNTATANWDQLINSASMPAAEAVPGNNGSSTGVYLNLTAK